MTRENRMYFSQENQGKENRLSDNASERTLRSMQNESSSVRLSQRNQATRDAILNPYAIVAQKRSNLALMSVTK